MFNFEYFNKNVIKFDNIVTIDEVNITSVVDISIFKFSSSIFIELLLSISFIIKNPSIIFQEIKQKKRINFQFIFKKYFVEL